MRVGGFWPLPGDLAPNSNTLPASLEKVMMTDSIILVKLGVINP